MAHKKISDEDMLNALVEKGSIRRAAEALGCDPKTVTNRLTKADFRKRYEDTKSAQLSETCGTLQSRLTYAVDVLSVIMADVDVPPTVRVSAADSVLRHGLRYVELCELERRIRALESAQEGDV